jgi:hypothetical protein
MNNEKTTETVNDRKVVKILTPRYNSPRPGLKTIPEQAELEAKKNTIKK